MQETYKNEQFIKTQRFRNIHGLGIAALALLGLAMAPAALAQSYTLNTIATFSGTYGNGQYPGGELALSGNTLYGVTDYPGTGHGEVYSVPITGGTPTVLASLNGVNGSYPYGGLTLSGSTLYGTTYGGTNGSGEVFSVPTTGGTPTILATFTGTNDYLQTGLTVSGSTLYGTTHGGGAYGDGEVFSIPITGGTPIILASFNGTNGIGPNGNLVLSGDTLYGTAYDGGPYNDSTSNGTVFSVPTTGGTPNVLAYFNTVNYGLYPETGLTLSNGILYGTTSQRGDSDGSSHGTVFSVPTTGGTPTILTSFTTADNSFPNTPLTLSGSTLYGITNPSVYTGVRPTLFSVPISGGTQTVIATFNYNLSQEDGPHDGLTLNGNTLYGTTTGNAANSVGTVFSLSLDQSPVPEASSVISLGLLLALGLGGMVIATKRSRTPEKGQH